jgi:hypothetical protein
MALTSPQKVSVAEITYETYAKIDSLASSLNSDQETSILADLATWATIRDSHVKLKGGSDGVDFDNERKREAIRMRIRKALGLRLRSPEMGGAIGSVYAGGLSQSERDNARSDTDRMQPGFTVDLHQT